MPPGTRNALVPPSPNYLQNAGQFVGGVGKGLANQFVVSPLQMVQQSYEDPYSLGQGIYEGARGLAADPVGVVGNALRGMWTRAKSGPAGLGEVVGENIDPRNFLKPRKALRKELDVYHGTPHTFDPETGAPLGRFRSSKIGTGEGAQAFGYGLYFAESPDVAKIYAVPRGIPDIEGMAYDAGIKNVTRDSVRELMRNANQQPDSMTAAKYAQNANRELRAYPTEQIAKVIAQYQDKLKSSFYKVDLPDAKIEQMLDWDKPLSEQQEVLSLLKKSKNKQVRQVIEQIGDVNQPITSYGQNLGFENGEGLMRRISYALDGKPNSPKASILLQKLGIPGIKYLDAGSRDGGKNTRNFVVFPGEEQHLNILSRD